MKEQRIVITGSTGLVGSYFCKLIDSNKYDVYTLVHSEPTNFGKSMFVELSNSMEAFRQIINEIRPDIIVHLAAMTDVDKCEIKRHVADSINHLSIRELANYIVDNKECFLLHVSTDYVFDGEKGNYDEADNVNPINWYGMTKLLGEQDLINCNSENWCIARTSTPFGMHYKKITFPFFVMKNLSSNHEIKVLTDQITSPTYASNLAEMLFEIVDKRLRGIIHVSGSSQISRFNQAIQIASLYNLDENLIKPITIEQMNWKAPRPKNSSLNIKKAYYALTKKPMEFRESLLQFTTAVH